MGDAAKKILFVNSEIFPYLPESDISRIGRFLPQGIQERKKEIRSFMPRYGCINERKNQLHEVIRLSGMNIIINDVDRPLVIKVIFFARGVLETVKKLRWAPDIVHCQGWISQILPLYLKKVYSDDPIFADSKVVLSLYDDISDETFTDDFKDKILFDDIRPDDVAAMEKPDGINLAKLAIRYSDGIIIGSENLDKEIASFAVESGLPVLPYNAEDLLSGAYIDSYNNFYDQF